MLEQLPENVMNHDQLKALSAKVDELSSALEVMGGSLAALIEQATSFGDTVNDVQGSVNGFLVEDLPEGEEEDEERRTTRMGLKERVAELEALVRGRNRSAPVKRNMTDADAVECLTGRAKDLDHKAAGEDLGLTYAQVYSCRLEYTFKHVHKQLRETGWKNPWNKK